MRLNFPVLLLLLLSGVWCNHLSAKDMELTLTEAINRDFIKVTAVSNGQQFNANALNIRIENTGKKTVNITIDPALIFVTKDTLYPPLLVAGNVKLNVQPTATANVTLQTYTARSNAFIPVANVTYTFSKQADSNTIKLLDYTKSHNINAELTQKAIWVFTDHKNVNTIYDPASDITSKNLALYLAIQTKQQVPGYYKYFALNVLDTAYAEPQPITTIKPLKIFAFFKWMQKEDADLNMIVTDEKGKTIQTLFEKQSFKKGGYEFTAKFESAEVESGNYIIKLIAGKTALKEIKVDVD